MSYIAKEPPCLDDLAFVEWLESQRRDVKFYSTTRARAYALANLFHIQPMPNYVTTMDQPPSIIAAHIRLRFARQIAERLK